MFLFFYRNSDLRFPIFGTGLLFRRNYSPFFNEQLTLKVLVCYVTAFLLIDPIKNIALVCGRH